MKRNILTAVLVFLTACSYAQNRVGLEVGAGMPLFQSGSNTSTTRPSVNTDIVFTADAYYLRRVTHHVYLGAVAAFEQYAFNYNVTKSDGLGGTLGTNVHHKSSYLQIGPMIDFGIGRYREYLHAYVNARLGFLVASDQVTRSYYDNNDPSLRYDNTVNTDFQVNGAMFRIGCGLKQHLPVSKMWQITFHEGYSFMPFGSMSQITSTGGVNLHPGYLTLQVGVMHKFYDARRIVRDR